MLERQACVYLPSRRGKAAYNPLAPGGATFVSLLPPTHSAELHLWCQFKPGAKFSHQPSLLCCSQAVEGETSTELGRRAR